MSLLNDALKRAQDAQGKTPPTPAPPLFHPPNPARSGLGWILPVAIVLFLAGAGIFFWLAIFAHSSSPKNSPAAAAAPVEVPALQEQKSEPAVVASAPATVPVSVPAPETNAAPDTNSAAPGLPAIQAQEYFPKVQAILLAGKPQAIVNGKIVVIGGRVGDYIVRKIEKDGVTFQRPDGSEKKLHLGE